MGRLDLNPVVARESRPSNTIEYHLILAALDSAAIEVLSTNMGISASRVRAIYEESGKRRLDPAPYPASSPSSYRPSRLPSPRRAPPPEPRGAVPWAVCQDGSLGYSRSPGLLCSGNGGVRTHMLAIPDSLRGETSRPR